MSSFTSLPDEVLKLVLKHVPLKHRLSSCCLVNRRLHAAAAAATDDVLLDPTPQSALDWLSNYGQYLTRLHLDLGFFSHPLQQLPCKDLVDLKLTGRCEEEIEATCGFRDVIQGCPKLTWLELDCNISDPEGAFVDCLCSLVHLQHLEVIMYEPYIEMPAAEMLHLNQLTYLNFEKLSLGSLSDLGNLTNLQELHLVVADDEVAVGPGSVTGLAFPASLETLVLVSSVEAAILSLAPPGLQDLRIGWDVEGPEEGPDSFLCHVVECRI
jgi:Leucine-rich repeat (LRR) protein